MHVIVAGKSVSITSSAAGNPAIRWQVSSDGGRTFTPLNNDGTYNGVTNNTLTVIGAGTALNGNQYEAVFSNTLNAGAHAASAPATLTVKPPLSITAALPQGTARTGYNPAITASGGLKPHVTFGVSNFRDGGTGRTSAALSSSAAAGTITVNGMPTAAGTATLAGSGAG